MKINFIVEGRLPTLNEYIDASRRNKYAANKMKKIAHNRIGISYFDKYKKVINFSDKGKVSLVIKYYEKDRRRDPDNVVFAKKFILDTLVGIGIIKNDGWEDISGVTEFIYLDKDNPRVEIEVYNNNEKQFLASFAVEEDNK